MDKYLTDSFRLWAKTERHGDRWHGLPFHLLDVGAAAEALWDRLPDQSLTVASGIFRGHARSVVSFLASTHDVGKANPYFQAKAKLRQVALADLIGKPLSEPCGHGQATGAYLRQWLMTEWRWSRLVAANVAKAIGGHHGRFFADTNLTHLRVDEQPWNRIGVALISDLARRFGALERVEEPTNLNAFLGWMSGFASVVDWLGSHEAMTVWETDPMALDGYLPAARDRASKLLDRLGFWKPPVTNVRSVGQLVPQGRTPNELQCLAHAIASSGFQFAVIEAPTGEGKTEAAFALYERERAAGAGAYFALPTMATANGLYDRVQSYLKSGAEDADVDARLLHSQAWMRRDKVDLVGSADDEIQIATAEDWFAGSKRGLLAPYAVGTVDQSLIAAMRARHSFVRLFAVAGKTVVIDEVHAYDVYMSDLIGRLLGWLRALGCRTILLSATLPTSRRRALFEDWHAGAELPEVEYPCVTWVKENGQIESTRFVAQARKPLTIQILPGDGEDGWICGAKRILDEIGRNGGLGAIILNTVREAQEVFSWLEGQVAVGIVVDLFHARFTAVDREEIEARVLRDFGKGRSATRASILVATQVVEQSLDLDFDFMVSALAPIDLLIQRAGRLHRHRRYADGQLKEQEGPDEREEPTLFVIPPRKDEANLRVPRDSIYATDVMKLTEELLRPGLSISEPRHIAEAVEGVYGPSPVTAARAEWEARLSEARALETAKSERRHDAAAEVMIPPALGSDFLTESCSYMDENDDVPGSQVTPKTRLEDLPTVEVVILNANDPVPSNRPTPREILFYSQRIVKVQAGGKRLAELLDIDSVDKWKKVGGLRYARLVRLDSDGRFGTPGYWYRYDRKVGLQWGVKGAEL